MPRKRRNNGRLKHNRGYVRRIHCEDLKTLVPRDKAIKKLNIKNFKDSHSNQDLAKSLLLPGYQIPRLFSYCFYSITAAFMKKIVKSRPKKYRKTFIYRN